MRRKTVPIITILLVLGILATAAPIVRPPNQGEPYAISRPIPSPPTACQRSPCSAAHLSRIYSLKRSEWEPVRTRCNSFPSAR